MAGALPATRLAAYLASLDAGDFDAAAEQFDVDVEYVRGPINPGESGLQRIVGRDALLSSFRDRGMRPYRHRLDTCLVEGPICLGHGTILDPRVEEARFFSFVEVTAESGLIGRYVASTVGRPTT